MSDRCAGCFNLEDFCTCPRSEPAKRETDYDRAYRQITVGMDREPTPNDFLLHKIGRDPLEDSMYLCPKCGLTCDPECDYGGWHHVNQLVELRMLNEDEDLGVDYGLGAPISFEDYIGPELLSELVENAKAELQHTQSESEIEHLREPHLRSLERDYGLPVGFLDDPRTKDMPIPEIEASLRHGADLAAAFQPPERD